MSAIFDMIHPADSFVLLSIAKYVRNPALDPIMLFFSVIGNGGAFWVLLSIVLIMTRKYKLEGSLIILALILGFIITNLVLKNLIQRPRPFHGVAELQAYTGMFADASSWSFPSGHTCSSFAAAFMVTALFDKRFAFFYIPAVLISFSRMYIGVHYPSDVIAGAFTGTLCAWIVYKVSAVFIR